MFGGPHCAKAVVVFCGAPPVETIWMCGDRLRALATAKKRTEPATRPCRQGSTSGASAPAATTHTGTGALLTRGALAHLVQNLRLLVAAFLVLQPHHFLLYFVSLTYNQGLREHAWIDDDARQVGKGPNSSGSSTLSELPGWNGGVSCEPSIVSGSGSFLVPPI